MNNRNNRRKYHTPGHVDAPLNITLPVFNTQALSKEATEVLKSPIFNVWADALSKMNSMRQKGALLCDIILRTPGSPNTYPAHRIILAATTTYFNKALLNPVVTTPQTMYQVYISDVGLSLILDFIYGQEVRLNQSNIDLFLVAAHHVGVQTAVTIGEIIRESLKKQTAMFATANQHRTVVDNMYGQPLIGQPLVAGPVSSSTTLVTPSTSAAIIKDIPIKPPSIANMLRDPFMNQHNENAEGTKSEIESEMTTESEVDTSFVKSEPMEELDIEETVVKPEPPMDEYMSAMSTTAEEITTTEYETDVQDSKDDLAPLLPVNLQGTDWPSTLPVPTEIQDNGETVASFIDFQSIKEFSQDIERETTTLESQASAEVSQSGSNQEFMDTLQPTEETTAVHSSANKGEQSTEIKALLSKKTPVGIVLCHKEPTSTSRSTVPGQLQYLSPNHSREYITKMKLFLQDKVNSNSGCNSSSISKMLGAPSLNDIILQVGKRKRVPKKPIKMIEPKPITKPATELQHICKVCSQGFKYYSVKVYHENLEHGVRLKPRRLISKIRHSVLCRKSSVSKYQRTSRRPRFKQDNFTCKKCFATFSSQHNFSLHQKMKHDWAMLISVKKLKKVCSKSGLHTVDKSSKHRTKSPVGNVTEVSNLSKNKEAAKMNSEKLPSDETTDHNKKSCAENERTYVVDKKKILAAISKYKNITSDTNDTCTDEPSPSSIIGNVMEACKVCGKLVAPTDLNTHSASHTRSDKQTGQSDTSAVGNPEIYWSPEMDSFDPDVNPRPIRLAARRMLENLHLVVDEGSSDNVEDRNIADKSPVISPVTSISQTTDDQVPRVKVITRSNKSCWLCHAEFGDAESILNHFQTEHGIKEKQILYKAFCLYPGCTYYSKSKVNVFHHMRRRHKHETHTKCTTCDKEFQSEWNLKRHMKYHKKELPDQSCKKCAYDLDVNVGHSKKCQLDNNDIKVYRCKLCDYQSNDLHAFENHNFCKHSILPHRQSKVYICNTCGYQTIRKTILNNHVLIHKDTKNYQCGQCSKKFRLANQLKAHMAIHNEARPYQCQFCNYATKAPRRLRQHIRVVHTDTDLKPFQCPYCTFETRLRSNCMKHVARMHAGQPTKVIKTIPIKE